MQKGSKSGGGQGSPDRAAEEQATTRGRKMVRKAFQGRIFLRDCFRFSPGTAYIVVKCAPPQAAAAAHVPFAGYAHSFQSLQAISVEKCHL